MTLPYVIDNEAHVLTDILKELLAEHKGRSLDVATAYFTVGGFGLVQEGLATLGNFRLLLGAEPTSGEQLGLRPDAAVVRGLVRRDLEQLPFNEKTLRLVEDLIAYLQRESVQVRLHDKGFLHAKCWLFYSDRPGQQMLFDRFRPILAIVGSSNFTAPGLTSNRELNLAHKVLLDPAEAEDLDAAYAVSWLSDVKPSERITPTNRQLLKSEVGARAIIDLESWYERQWHDGIDFKQDLISLLDASKFGSKEYTPYQVYMKALYEYFRDDLGGEITAATRSAVNLAEFQEDAVKKARKILSRYDGVMIADSVGLGKTWIGKKLLEDFAYHMRQKALIVCPASLREMWERELGEASIAATVLSQEELGRDDFDPFTWGDADIVLIDESHNFRNPNSNRYGKMESLLGYRSGMGRDGARKKVILLTATPINNDLFDLYNQFCLITRGDRSYFGSSGIGDLYRYFLKARRDSRAGEGVFALFNLLEEVVIRRTRPFIRMAYPTASFRKREPDGSWSEQLVRFPERKLKTVYYNLEATYAGIYDEVVSGIESLKLAPYNLEDYKKAGVEIDKFEAGREEALVGIFKSRYLKRFESSIEAFRISVRRALAFLKTFESYILDGRLIKSSDFQKMIRFLASEDEEDDATPVSLAEEIDANAEARAFLETLGSVDASSFNLRKLHEAVQHDVEVLSNIWQRVKDISPAKDAKLSRLKDLLSKDLKGKKVLVFSYYKDTARYLYRHLGHPENPAAVAFSKKLGNLNVRRMDSGADARERLRIVEAFAPKSNGKSEWVGTDKEIDLLISTDVLSEGQNLQDCGYLINYDLHWNPTRMVQRAGRIDRIGTEFETLWIYNMFPDQGLERLLGLVQSLNQKIADIDQAGFLDASVLGETVHPRNFNTLRRISEEDGSVIEEEEQFTELASSEFLMQQLRALIDAGGQESLDSLPDGIHSGLAKAGARGVFFYFQGRPTDGGKSHFWKYYDLKDRRIIDNRFILANLIACQRDTPRVVDAEAFAAVFEIQEKIVDDILQSEEQKRALEVAPRAVDPIQQTVATAIQSFLNHPDVDRKQAIEAIRFLNQPMLTVQVRKLRQSFREFQAKSDIKLLLSEIEELKAATGSSQPSNRPDLKTNQLNREDLRLICFDLLTSG
jgi:superfamily II DNA or RNA helicase